MEAMRSAAALFAAGRWDESRAACERILRSDPRHFYALHLLATLAARHGRWEESRELATRALEVDPNHVEVLCNRGAALRMLDRLDEALADYDRAIAVSPNSAEALNNRGVALAALNRNEEAVAGYSRALELKPDYARARFNRALSHLVLGDYERGWVDHESRWGGSQTQGPARGYPQPQLTARDDVRGKTVLVHAEQGIGDVIQFARYVPLLQARGARVVLEVHPPLKTLMAGLAGVDRVIAIGEDAPPFDYYCPILSLPLAFGTRLDSIPGGAPYLQVPRGDVERLRARLGPLKRPLIGLAWSGSSLYVNDRKRSMGLSQLDVVRRENCTFFVLQKGIRDEDRPALESGPALLNLEAEIADFRETAVLTSLMDVVISVDTSVAHLAGALGRPLWLMLPFAPDWRWLLDREDTPWYPSARLFRQPRPGDWDSVVARVASELFSLSLGRG